HDDAGGLNRFPRIPCGGHYPDFVENLWAEPREVLGKEGVWRLCWCSHPLSPNSVVFSKAVGDNLAATRGHGAPAVAIPAPDSLFNPVEEKTEYFENPSFLDIILWMPAPKSRLTIEVNCSRRRNSGHLIKIKRNTDICPECGNLKEKHVLCGYCYEKVKLETYAIKNQIRLLENGPHKAPTVESVVLYTGEKPRNEDEDKRIIERNRKRPSWFTLD
ncbi:39S ribosomal protein L32, mitochondrial-like, partial [Thamnophis elegans]|uniref:39S ribosomal protein L32, mitochondrial-like n=1 Tax=Thamnophis elegans TaxID=35005 RepID=UPI0013779BE5